MIHETEILSFFAQYLPATLVGAVLAFIINLTGVGAGAISIPVVIVFFNMDAAIAVGTVSLFQGLTKLMSGIDHARLQNIAYRKAWIFLGAAIPMTLLSSFLVNYFLAIESGKSLAQIKSILKVLIIVAVFLSVLLIIFSKRHKNKSDEIKRKFSKSTLFISGGGIGLIFGATGISGVLIVPALMLCSGEGLKRVVGLTIFVALALSAINSFMYAQGGQLDLPFAIAMSVGAFFGVFVSGKAMPYVNESYLEKFIIVLILISLALMIAN